MMFRRLHIWISTTVMLWVLIVGSVEIQESHALPHVGVAADLGQLQGLEQAHQNAMERRRDLERQFGLLEREFEDLADKIEALKRRGQRDGTQERALQKLLRSAQSVSASLSRLQGEMRSVDETISMVSSQLVSGLDQEMRQVERGLGTARGAARKRLVGRLNHLSKERAQYAAPLPKLDTNKLNSMLRLAEAAQDPDDMLAMAEELSDAEVDVRKKLDWVQHRLRELKRRRRLLARANDFSRQQRFFEESDRTQTVSRRVRTKQTPPNTSSDENNLQKGAENQNNTNGLNNGNNQPAPPDGHGDFRPSPGEGDPSAGLDPGQNPSDPDAEIVDRVDPNAEPDPFGGTDLVVETSRPDPSAPSRGAYFDDADLDARIKKLEKDRAKLKRQARTLKHRVTRLRKGAEAVD